MICPNCSRELKEDSRYCDGCGFPVTRTETKRTGEFDYKGLAFGIVLSIVFTAAITVLAHQMGLPILFGGLFLPFFFRRKKVN